MKITDDPESLECTLKMIDATIVLHNMLIDFDSAEPRNAAWDASVVTELTAIDDADRIPERLVLDNPIPIGGTNDLRRDQLMRYCAETYEPNYNISANDDHISLEEWSPIGEWSVGSEQDDELSDIDNED